jgi:DNA invertase Pin-like site-specific DNA recombinase
MGSGLTMGRPGLLDFHTAAEDGKVDVLLIYSLTRLGRDTDKVIKYWHLLRDLGVSIHTANSDEVDMSVATILCEIIK